MACLCAVAYAIGGGGLEPGADVRPVPIAQGCVCLNGLQDRGLEAGEREIAAFPAGKRARQGETVGIAGFGGALHFRAAGEAQTQKLGGLVEGFAQGIVNGGAKPPVAADAFDDLELGVAARDEEQEIGKCDAVGQPRGQCVALQMVDRDQGNAAHQGNRLCRHQADNHAADEPWAGGGGDRVYVVPAAVCLGKCVVDHVVKMGDMGARGDFRHHAAIGFMGLVLGPDRIGEDGATALPVAPHDGGGGLVAGRFDAEHREGPAGPDLAF